MKKVITQIRDIDQIEKELKVNPAGVLAVNVNDELVQLATTFLYQDKNIYFFFDNNDDFLENLKYDTEVSFVVIKNNNVKKTEELDFNPVYNILSISVAGLIKIVEDDKMLATLRQNYLRKYSSKADEKDKMPKLNKIIFIDTEEIQAFEETGG